jgi:transcriptional regulator with XRE-family HTH domain
MQQKKDNMPDFMDRFEKLRRTLDVSVALLCKKIGISRSQLYAIRAGEQKSSEKMDKRLSEAESNAGIAPPANHAKFFDLMLEHASLEMLVQKLEALQENRDLSDLERWQFTNALIPKIRQRLEQEKTKR